MLPNQPKGMNLKIGKRNSENDNSSNSEADQSSDDDSDGNDVVPNMV